MRWDNLRIEAEEGTRLPGYRDGAVVRRFDAPEALDMRFYEVHAKSALNRVPEASAMPFRWTINPYRGCSHACVYCLSGDTQVLMAGGALRPISELRAGDAIFGTEEADGVRRLVPTTVIDQWSSVKPAFRITLADGTELVGSADHRFLTADGTWRHVAEGAPGTPPRPLLSTEHALVGWGMAGPGAIPDDQYRDGYLCGLLRGDPRLGVASRHAPPADPEVRALRRARMAPAALDRVRDFLESAGIAVDRAALTPTGPLPAAIVGPDGVAPALRALISWPRSPSSAWRRGFLAGMFDAEGSVSDGVLRITSEDPVLLSWASSSLRDLGFAATRKPPWPAVSHEVCVDGGPVAQLRFRHAVDPARPLSPALAGTAVATEADLRVVAIEPLGGGAQRLFDLTTGTGDFIANGVVSHNCFARPTHTYLDFGAGRDFEREIVVKVNVPEVLRAELKRASWKGEHVAMGTNTDPYQWVEGRYRLMPGIWEALRDFRNPCSVLTKSPLVLRDLPLLREIAEVTEISANLSVPTIDERAWRATEPHTPNPKARLEAVAELNRNGIPTGILVAPLMPGINDDPAQVERIVQTAIEAGATSIGGIGLHLRREVRDVFMEWLRACRPELVDHYEELYARGAYLPPVERERLAGLLHRAGARRARPFRRDPALVRGRDAGTPRGGPVAPPAAVQEALF